MSRSLSLLRRARPQVAVPAIGAVLGVVALAASGSSGKEQPLGTVPVQRGSVVATVSADGNVQSPQELALNFEGFGRLVDVAVREGNHVARGEVLARIDNGTQRGQLGSAEANLDAARARLEATRHGLTPTELALRRRLATDSQVAVRNAQRDLADTRTSANTTVAGLRRSVARARVTGEEADLQEAQLRLSQEQNQVNILRNQFETVRDQVDADRQQLFNQLDRLRDAENDGDQQEINGANFQVSVLQSKIADGEFDEARAKEDLRVGNANVNTYVQEVVRDRVALREARRRLGAVGDDLRNGIAGARQQVDSARDQLATTQSQLSVTIARNQVDEQVKAEDVATSIAGVAQAESLLRDARKAVDDTLLRAPVDGVVGHVNAKLGELTGGALRSTAATTGTQGATPGAPAQGSPNPSPSPGSPAAALQPIESLMTLAQTRGLQVKANFNETDAASIHTGDSATVTVDAFPDKPLRARVAAIDPVQTVQGNVVTYEVTLVLEGAFPGGLRPGMSATADVTVARADQVLIVPRTAVRSPQGANPSVIVVRPDGRQEIRMVATGLQSDTQVQVLAGVGLGERVLRTISPPPDGSPVS
jgi:multidrug efflux pump subunit AcrA (membrane-fusion protein)